MKNTTRFGLLAMPSAASKPLPSVGGSWLDLPPAKYAAYFTEDESRIRELFMRIAKITEAYLRHSTAAIEAAALVVVTEEGTVVEETLDAEGEDAIHSLFLAAEEHSVLLAPLLYWVGYPDALADEDNRRTCELLANAAMAQKEAMLANPAIKPLFDYARDVYGVVSF